MEEFTVRVNVEIPRQEQRAGKLGSGVIGGTNEKAIGEILKPEGLERTHVNGLGNRSRTSLLNGAR